MTAAHALRRAVSTLAPVALAAVVAGCAHPISLAGNAANLSGTGKAKIDKAAGLAVTEEDRKREVTSPGGGGDKVRYLPWRDLETGLYIALSESFTRVVRVAGATDPKVKAEGLNYVVTPRIVTTSYSPSLVTWPPTSSRSS